MSDDLGVWGGFVSVSVLREMTAEAELAKLQVSMAERDEAQRLRDELLASLGVVRTFTAGAALIGEPGAAPSARRATAIVTADELVLLDADVVRSPEEVIGRFPLREITRVRLVDEFGDPVAANDVDPILELDAPVRRFVVWLDRRSEDGTAGASVFVFLAGSVALEAKHHFERLIVRSPA